jgi:acylphosphatase
MLIARRYRITGRVQGVGFRFFAEDAARREGLGGWVRNATDGVVEALAEGDRDAVLRFEHAIRMGPRGARVDAVDVTEEMPSGRAPVFAIRDEPDWRNT